jgi:hypothetical protein
MAEHSESFRWPVLPAPYVAALREAVTYVLESFDADGIIATGTIVRGNPHASSDLDLYVVHRHAFRQRVQRFFRAVPVEIFVNPPEMIRSYFEEEHASGRPITAHMLATGAVVLARTPVVDELCREATSWLAKPSYPTEGQALRMRYAAATRFEDGIDVVDIDPATANMVLSEAVSDMLQLYCRTKRGTLPRQKDLLSFVAELDPALGEQARRFFGDATFAERREVAEDIADRTIGVRGFFTWDSGPEPVV